VKSPFQDAYILGQHTLRPLSIENIPRFRSVAAGGLGPFGLMAQDGLEEILRSKAAYVFHAEGSLDHKPGFLVDSNNDPF
jgi:hypothetical protein